MKPQITKAFFPSGQFKNRKGKKNKKKHLIQNQEKGLWASQAVGLSPHRTHSRICSENSETPRPTDCVLGMGEGPGHLCAQTKGQRCRQLHLCPPPRLRASCAPIEVPEVALTHAGAQNTSFCLNCGQAL